MLRNCMFARHSVATRHISIVVEKPSEAPLETVRAVDVTIRAATRAADCASEMSTSDAAHLFEVWSRMYPEGQTRRQ